MGATASTIQLHLQQKEYNPLSSSIKLIPFDLFKQFSSFPLSSSLSTAITSYSSSSSSNPISPSISSHFFSNSSTNLRQSHSSNHLLDSPQSQTSNSPSNSSPNPSYLKDLKEIDLNTSFIIFISHSWLQINKTNYFQPDNNKNEKYLLCKEGIELLQSSLITKDLKCYLWIDCCCTNIIDQDRGYIENLDEIIQLSDLLFTPIITTSPTSSTTPSSSSSSSNFETKINLPLIGGDILKDYRIKLWNGTKFAYTNRDICRWELYLGSTIPLSSYSIEKQSFFMVGLKEMAKMGRRPHFLYDTNMKSKHSSPICLPVTSKSFQTILPKICFSNRTAAVASSTYLLSERQETIRNLLQQKSSIESNPTADRPNDNNHADSSHSTEDFIEQVSSVPNIHDVQEVFDSHLTGYHVHKTLDGDIYEGEWSGGKWHGHGRLISNVGAVTTGCWENGVLNGTGTYIFPQGDIYEGEWLNSQWHGKGTLSLINGDKYIGEFCNGIRSGYGVFQSPQSGRLYEGEWDNNVWSGKGKLTLSNGDIYEGNYHNGQLNGQGIYLKPSIESYEGEWCDDQWNGYGIYTIFQSKENSNDDIVQEGYWENGKLIPEYNSN